MELIISITCALGGLIFGLLFLWDLVNTAIAGGTSFRRWLMVGVKLVLALLLLHFHVELDILD